MRRVIACVVVIAALHRLNRFGRATACAGDRLIGCGSGATGLRYRYEDTPPLRPGRSPVARLFGIRPPLAVRSERAGRLTPKGMQGEIAGN
jgi:hypothetical protein